MKNIWYVETDEITVVTRGRFSVKNYVAFVYWYRARILTKRILTLFSFYGATEKVFETRTDDAGGEE